MHCRGVGPWEARIIENIRIVISCIGKNRPSRCSLWTECGDQEYDCRRRQSKKSSLHITAFDKFLRRQRMLQGRCVGRVPIRCLGNFVNEFPTEYLRSFFYSLLKFWAAIHMVAVSLNLISSARQN